LRDSKWVDWGVNWARGRRFAVLGEPGKWLGVWGLESEMIVEMACGSGRWATVARLESGGVRGMMMSCQLGRETRGIHTI